MTISARVIAHSTTFPPAPPIVTVQLRYPKFIHGELMTHRVFSRNASSSRAIPVKRLIQDVIDDPVYPMHWGKNQPGMQAHEECDEVIFPEPNHQGDTRYAMSRTQAWDAAREQAIAAAEAFDRAGYHKQIVNRLLEPFCHINVLVTSTEWDNFFELRCHPDAQPEMRMLAEAIRNAISASDPTFLSPGDWHLPYVDDMIVTRRDICLSVARCARVSYLTQEGKPPSIEEDLKLYERLVGSVPLHASPAEHQATPDTHDGYEWSHPKDHGNFNGWRQYRKMLEKEMKA